MTKRYRQPVEEFDESDFETEEEYEREFEDHEFEDEPVDKSKRQTLKLLGVVLGTGVIGGGLLFENTLKVMAAKEKIDQLKEKLEGIKEQFNGVTLTVLLRNPSHYAALLNEGAGYIDEIVLVLKDVIEDEVCIHPLYLQSTKKTIRQIVDRFRTSQMQFLFNAAMNYVKGRTAVANIKGDIVRALGGYADIVGKALNKSPSIRAGSALVQELDGVAQSLSMFLLSLNLLLQKLKELQKSVGDLGCEADVDDASNDPILSKFIEGSKGDKLAERKKMMKRLRWIVAFSYEPNPEDQAKVWALQQVLYDNGFFPPGFPEDRAVDGDFGRSTTAANELFKKTIDSGYSYSRAYHESGTVSHGPYARRIQQLMANYGYYHEEVDGAFGESSYRSYEAFAQAAWGN